MFTAEPVTQKLLYLTTQESERGHSRAVLFGPRMSYNSNSAIVFTVNKCFETATQTRSATAVA